jgi:acyl carrier protein
MNTEERVIKVIAYVLGIKWHSEIHSDFKLVNNESIGLYAIHTELMHKALEKEFNMVIPPNNIHTVKEVCNYIDNEQ